MKLQEIKEIIETKPVEALEWINKIDISLRNKDYYLIRIAIFQKLNRNTDAVNDCIEALKLFGSDEFIENQKQYLETIIRMTQLDVYACTNLQNDPWD